MTFILFVLVVVAVVMVRSLRSDAEERLETLEAKLAALRREVWELRVKAGLAKGKAPSDLSKKAAVEDEKDDEEETVKDDWHPSSMPPPPPLRPKPMLNPPPRPLPPLKPPPRLQPVRPVAARAATPAPSTSKAAPRPSLPSIDWEQFTGVKLFAWLGGVALFLAAGFFVKYSIDNDLLPPQLRLAISALVGLGLIVASFRFDPKRYDVLRQSLAAGGVGILFAVVFAATLYYRFIGAGMGFGLLALTALAAFALAAAQKAPATAVLGALGAWIALALIETGQSSLAAVFFYLALVAVSLHQVARRLDLAWLGAFGSFGTLAALAGAQGLVVVAPSALEQALAWTGQLALLVAAVWRMPWDPEKEPSLGMAAVASYAAALLAGLSLLQRPGWEPALIATVSLALLLLLGMRQKPWGSAALLGAFFTWLLLLAWAMTQPLQAASLPGLSFLLGFGLVGGLGPVLLLRDPQLAFDMRRWLLVYPLALAILGLGMVITHPGLPALFWPVDFVLQLLGLGLAIIAGGLWVALFCLGGLLLSVAIWIHSPVAAALLVGPLFFLALLVGGLVLVALMLWMGQNLASLRERLGLRKAVERAEAQASFDPRSLLPWVTATPVLSAFLLLAMVFQRLPEQSPHTGMATALSLLLLGLGLAQRLKQGALGAVTALSVVLPLAAWTLTPAPGLLAAGLAWTLGLWAVLSLAPFLLYRPPQDWRDGWCGHALAMALLSLLAVQLARQLFEPQTVALLVLGLALLQVAAVASLLRSLQGQAARNDILAFWGAALLLLVTALPVLLLDRAWLGLALVFEGAALVWLNGRVPHPLLPMGGLGFALYGIGSMVLGYGALRGEAAEPMLNPGFLAFAAATLLQTWAAVEARRQSPRYPLRWRLGQRWTAVGLGFYLLNLGIAEFFAGGPSSGFDLRSEGRWAQYVLYTLSWAAVGGGLWAFLRRRSIMAWLGLGLLFLAVGRALALPFFYPQWVPSLGPWVNAAWMVYLPLLVLLGVLRVWELRRGGGGPARALLWAWLLLALLAFKIEASSTLQGGDGLRLFMGYNPAHALGQAAGWTVFSLFLLLWPRPLEREFRLFGLFVLLAAVLRGAWLPVGYARAWSESLPLLNGPWLLLFSQVSVLAYLAWRPWPQDHWPLETPARSLLGSLAVLGGFFALNVGVAQAFRQPGEPLRLTSGGRFGHRLSNSLTWMLYGLGLLGLGIRSALRPLRMAGLALVAVTAFKVFLGDLRHLGQLYRVAAFVGLAVALLLVSYLYQRFVSQAPDPGKKERP